MDSYEYYLLFHLDKPAFLSALSDRAKCENDELIVALERLILNGKVNCDKIKEAALSMVTSKNNIVEWILDQLITNIQPLKIWIDRNDLESNPPAYFRVVRLLIKKSSCSNTEVELFKDIATKIVQYVYREAVIDRPEAIACLRSMMEQQQVSQWVTSKISQKLDRTDSVSLKNLCYFFDVLCNHNCIEDEGKVILKYFGNSDSSARKQGVFLIKTLIEFRKLSSQDEESFKKFIVIVETLEESQHLISPTLELIKQFDFSEKFQDFWFVTCRMVLNHESSLVKQWGLNFILSATPPAPFNEKQTFEILEAFNSTSLLDNFESLCAEPLREFIVGNMSCVFHSLIEINWTSFTFYRVLEVIAGNIRQITKIDDKFLETLRLQTEIIPKRIKNLVIRNGVQIQYSKVATSVVEAFGLNSSTLSIIYNVFNIGIHYQLLEPCLENAKTEDFVEFFRPFVDNEEFFQFSLIASSQKCNFDQIEQKCRLSASQNSLMVYTISGLKVESVEKLAWLKQAASLLLADFRDAIIAEDAGKVASNIASVRKNSKALISSGCIDKYFHIDKARFETLKMEIFGPVYFLLRELDVVWMNEDFAIIDGNSTELWRQYQILQHLEKQSGDFIKFHKILKSNIELRLDECLYEGLHDTLKIVHKMVALPWPEPSSLADLLDKLTNAIFYIDDGKFELLQLFTDIVLKAADVSLKVPDIDNQLRDSLTFAFGKINQKDKTRIVHHLVENLKSHAILDTPSALKEYFGVILIEQIKETPMQTKEQLTEMQVSYEIELLYNRDDDGFSISDKKSLRLGAAILLSEKFATSYPQIIENFMEEFAKASYNKPRYFPNAWIHRMKMHYLQAIFFSAALTPRTIEILIWELLNINNQRNVTYMLEIILARHHPNIVGVLKDEEQVFKLKAPAVKSIFAIAVMQLNRKNDSKLSQESEMSHEKYHDLIFPFTMGQNYGVRAYAQAAIAILHRNVAASPDQQETEFTRRLAKSANIITSSMKFKNSAKFYEALKEDFRYKFNFDDIWTPEVFYNIIPSLTKMPFDEIVSLRDYPSFSKDCRETFEIAEFNDEPEMSTLTEELVVQGTPQVAASNLQIKYKYQVPGDDLMNIYPSLFESAGGLHQKLKNRSNLIVVASLVNRPPNLGGLARTCEIFGVENYVIESLKLVENSEFRAVSKTAEKWLKISEVKPFQLSDFLIGMRRKGYTIVGSEQSENAVSLEEAVIPQKTVLLLGNEKEGIPAILLSLLDLTIEIPQTGIVRSLNVHVSGAVVIWEYFKQHRISICG